MGDQEETEEDKMMAQRAVKKHMNKIMDKLRNHNKGAG